MPRGPSREHGFALIGGYLLLLVFLGYSGAIALRTATQGLVAERFRDRVQALNLAQAAQEQLREELYRFLTEEVYQTTSDADASLAWLDSLDTGAPQTPLMTLVDRNADGLIDPATDTPPAPYDGAGANPRCVTTPQNVATNTHPLPILPANGACAAVGQPVSLPRAWIVSVVTNGTEDCDGDGLEPGEDLNEDGVTDTFPTGLGPRCVTIRGEAQVGPIRKVVQATYAVTLGTSDIFRYAYFVNNFGRMHQSGSSWLQIFGDVRTNADFMFSDDNLSAGQDAAWRMWIGGDVYAADNPALPINPLTGAPANGDINEFWDGRGFSFRPGQFGNYLAGDPGWNPQEDGYWWSTSPGGVFSARQRPGPFAVIPGQIPINGQNLSLPTDGRSFDNYDFQQGYNGNGALVNDLIIPQFYEAQPVQPMAYLGDLSMYEAMAGQQGGSLTYTTWNPGTDGIVGTADDVATGTQTIAAVQSGSAPVALVGTTARPILLDGPVVIHGDVIIKGTVRGRGTIYSGRNVHVAGQVVYYEPAVWPRMERDSGTGRVRIRWCANAWQCNRGTVCNNGAYYAPGVAPPPGCI